MNYPDLPFGKTIECECGKTHHVDPEVIVYADDAVEAIPRELGRFCEGRGVAVIFDTRTREVAGKAAAGNCAAHGWDVREVLVGDPSPGASPVCDKKTYDFVHDSCSGANAVLAVGSGVLSDLGKWSAASLDLPYACFATAASMNGYSSANVAAILDGVKAVVRARPPKAVFSSSKVLREAPFEMTASGLGDVLAKSVSSADWRMNKVLFGDYYCERSNALITGIEPLCMEHPENIRSRDSKAIEGLFQALMLTGAAMTMAETSTPASGGEHLVSHALDMMSMVDGGPHGMHGSQVGIGTVLASEVYRRVLEAESPVFGVPPGGVDRPFWAGLADEVESHFRQKQDRIAGAAAELSRAGAWDRLKEELKPFIRSPERIQDCLKRGGAPWRAQDIGCSRDRLLSAFLHAHEIRERFTVLDLARLAGILPAQAAEIVEQWA